MLLLFDRSRLPASHSCSLHVDTATDQGLQGENPTGRRQCDHGGAWRGRDGACAHPRGGLLPVLGVCHGLLWHRLRGVLRVDGCCLCFGQCARVGVQWWRRGWRRWGLGGKSVCKQKKKKKDYFSKNWRVNCVSCPLSFTFKYKTV